MVLVSTAADGIHKVLFTLVKGFVVLCALIALGLLSIQSRSASL